MKKTLIKNKQYDFLSIEKVFVDVDLSIGNWFYDEDKETSNFKITSSISLSQDELTELIESLKSLKQE